MKHRRRVCGGFEFGCDLEESEEFVDPNRTRTKADHPYSYDEFFIFGNRTVIRATGVSGDYSDRLWEWDPKKFDQLWKEHVGSRWSLATKSSLSTFMSLYNGEKREVIALAEGCNPSNGYPYWVVWHRKAVE